jgi:SprT-like protein
MTPTELQRLVERISADEFNQPFKHVARFNTRLRTTGGRYLLRTHDIEINPWMLTEFDETNLIGVIRHELVHYHLHVNGLPYQHKDQAFKTLLAQVEGARYAPTTSKRRVNHTYECPNGHRMERQRRVNIHKYVCGKCKGRLREVALVKE